MELVFRFAQERGTHNPPIHNRTTRRTKASRGCYKIKGQGLLHVVSAWDTENGIALGQLATKNDEGKDVGEYNTIPALIETLDIKDALVTIDAGVCYANIVDAVVEGEGNYLITVTRIRYGQPLFPSRQRRLTMYRLQLRLI